MRKKLQFCSVLEKIEKGKPYVSSDPISFNVIYIGSCYWAAGEDYHRYGAAKILSTGLQCCKEKACNLIQTYNLAKSVRVQ